MNSPPPEKSPLPSLTEVAQCANAAVDQATVAAKTCCEALTSNVESSVVRARESMKQNPIPMLLGALALGMAVGCLLVLTRRGHTLQERFVDDPIQTTRDTLYAALAPVAKGFHDGYDSASKAIHELHPRNRSLANHVSSLRTNLKFW